MFPSQLMGELNDKFKKIRSQGYAYCAVPSEGHQSYAFSITDGTKTIAALGILYPDSMDTPEYRMDMLKNCHIAAHEISRRLEFA